MEQNCCICNYLSAVSVEKLTMEEKELLEKNSLRVNYKQGDIIIKQNAFVNSIYYLTNGLVKKHMTGLNGKQQIIDVIKAPGYIGIPTALGNSVNKYSVTALTNCKMCMIELSFFKQLCCKNAFFSFDIIQEMCQKELKQFCDCFNRTQKNAKGLVAEMLIYFAESVFNSNSFRIPLTRNEISDLINISREQTSRILSEFNDDNIIAVHSKDIIIKNFDLLGKISRNG
jgi:CRP-like cAMP-binding protein